MAGKMIDPVTRQAQLLEGGWWSTMATTEMCVLVLKAHEKFDIQLFIENYAVKIYLDNGEIVKKRVDDDFYLCYNGNHQLLSLVIQFPRINIREIKIFADLPCQSVPEVSFRRNW